MSMVNARAKGAAAEREAAAVLNQLFGTDIKRSFQVREGGKNNPDLALGDIHIEVKRQETISLWAWWKQAAQDAGTRIPALMFRRNRADWMFCCRVADLPQVVRELAESEREAERV